MFHEFGGPTDGFGQHDDEAAFGILDYEGHVVFDADHGFVAGRNGIATADAFGRGGSFQHADHAARLTKYVDLEVSCDRGGHAPEPERDRVSADHIGIAQAIGPGEGDVVLVRDVCQALLGDEAVAAHLGKARCETHDAAEILGRQALDRLDDAGPGHGEHREIDAVR